MKNLNIKIYLITLLLIICNWSVKAQDRCGTQNKFTPKQIAQEIKRMKLNEPKIKQWIKNSSLNTAKGAALPALVTIPVVVHILYNSNHPEQNISDAQVISQIAALNRDYRKLNTDADDVPEIFKPVAADCQIEFCLAQRTPTGFPTNGITRTITPVDGFVWLKDEFPNLPNYYKKGFHNNTGGIDAWDTNKYLNIWVGDFIDIHGISSFPGSAGLPEDGCFVRYTSFGTSEAGFGQNLEPAWTEGGITTHEIGHYLGLYHTFSDYACSSLLFHDDGIEDTPKVYGYTEGCPNYVVLGCGYQPAMTMNFMDYPDDPCINMFTLGQKVIMLGSINLYRSSLKTSNGCVASLLCNKPLGLKVSSITPTSVVLNWDNDFYTSTYTVEVFNGLTWGNPTVITAPTSSLMVNGLLPGKNYKFRVKSYCLNASSSIISDEFPFTTLPYCNPDTYEPNNTFATAYYVAPSTFSLAGGATKNVQISGGLICKDDAIQGGTSGDLDWFWFRNTSFRGAVNPLWNYPDVKIDLSQMPSNYIVELYNAANVKIGTYTQSSIIYHPCYGATGSYYIKVYRNNNEFNLSQTFSFGVVLTAISYACPPPVASKTTNEKVENEDLITLFPNPSQGKFNINSCQKIKTITVSDLNGKLILMNEVNAFLTNYELDITAYPAGNYIITVQGDFGIATKKLIKN